MVPSPTKPLFGFGVNQSGANSSSTPVPSTASSAGLFGDHLSRPAMTLFGSTGTNGANTGHINEPNKAQFTTLKPGAPGETQPRGTTMPQFTFGAGDSVTNSPFTTSASRLFGPPQSQPSTSVSPGGMPRNIFPSKGGPMPGLFGSNLTDNTPKKQRLFPPLPAAIVSSKTMMNGDIDHQDAVREHFSLLGGHGVANNTASEITSAPLFTGPTLRSEHAKLKRSGRPKENFSQYGLLGGVLDDASDGFTVGDFITDKDPRIFQNVAAPMSAFICGSQGSGKSHTLSCMLENCLLASPASHLPRPLTGLVFHYDSFVSDSGGAPCEAAYLSSHEGIKVKVLCAPTNVGHIKRIYSVLPKVTVEEFRINEADLNTKRMMDLMAFNPNGAKGTPLYLHVINRILRDLRIEQQRTNRPFSYDRFKTLVYAQELTEGQSAPLKQRLETLESFMVTSQAQAYNNRKKGIRTPTKVADAGNDWKPKAGQLTIVDMSCPCVTAEMACSLFNIALSLFLEQQSNIGRVIALDEAHKYMIDSMESQTLTENLMATIRLQRHLGARIIIATQEPTISPKLLDLCSVTVVHRFTSPDWLQVLRQHLAGVSSRSTAATIGHSGSVDEDDGDKNENEIGVRPLLFDAQDIAQQVFSRIIALRTGEALVFSPTAIVGMKEESPPKVEVPKVVVPVKEEGQSTSSELLKVDAKVTGATSPDSLAPLTPVSEAALDFPSAPDAQAGDQKPLTESPRSKMKSVFGQSGKDEDLASDIIPPGTSSSSFHPSIQHEQPPASTALMQNISFQDEFKKWSSDELRLVDHIAGPKPDHVTSTTSAAAQMLSSGINDLILEDQKIPVRLGRGVLKVRIRGRVTTDGGKSIFAT